MTIESGVPPSISRKVWATCIGILLLLAPQWGTAGIEAWTPIGPSVHVNIVADRGTNDLYALGNDSSLLLRSSDFGASWSVVPPPAIAGCHFAFSVVPGAGLFAAGAFPNGGPFDAQNCDRSHYKSTDLGASWTLLPPWPSVFPTTGDPTNPSIVYGVSVPTSVYKSIDGGATWSLLPTGTPVPFGLDAIVVDANTPTTLYVFGGKSNFLKSTDGGANWVTANAGLPGAPDQPNSGIVGLVQVGSTLILGTDGSGVYRSTDGAATWMPANAGLANLQLVGLVNSNESPPTIYAQANNGNSTTFYRSTDGATTWMQTGTLNAPFAGGLAFTAQSPPVAYATSAIGLFRSTDGTESWARVPPTANLPNDPVPILLGDRGDPWRLYASISPFQSYGLTSADRGNHWSLLAFPDGTPVILLSARTSRPNIVYGRNPLNGVLVRSFDLGAHWSTILPPLRPGLSFAGITSVIEGTSDSFVLYAVGNQDISLRLPGSVPVVLRSDNSGGEWVDASQGLPTSSQPGVALQAIAIDPTNNDALYAATDGGLFKTIDGGASWNPIGSGFPANPVSTLVVDPSHPNIVYAAFGISPVSGRGAGVFASVDGGSTWNSRNTGLTDFAVTALAIDRNDPQSLYAGTSTQGVFRTTDGGMRWTPLSNGLPSGAGMQILSLEVDPADGANVLAGTADGAFAFTLGASTPYVPVIEFYAPNLDHYFIATEAQPDVAALDSGAIPGWVRTGEFFRALPGPLPGTSPVCRFYIPPAYGDSHFFSASPAECAQVQVKFPFFELETPNAFYVHPPDAAGACPQGTVELYRLWDARPDTNHRYTTDPAVRAQMIARGWLPEGSGIGVVACVPGG